MQFALDESLNGTSAILWAAGLGDPMSRPVIMVASSRVGVMGLWPKKKQFRASHQKLPMVFRRFSSLSRGDNDKLSASAMFNSCHKGI